MAKQQFGLDQINNPTPTWVMKALQLYVALAGAVVTWLSTTGVELMGPKSYKLTTGLIGLSLLVATAISPFFGVDVKSKYVKTSDVTAMDQPEGN